MERVRDYPRPPRLEASQDQIRVEALGEILVETQRSLRVLETFHPPTYYPVSYTHLTLPTKRIV